MRAVLADDLEPRLKALMLAGLAGDAAAHRNLLSQLAVRLRAYFGRRVAAAADVEDLVQETLIAIHNRRDTYDSAQPLTAWVFALARYKMIDSFRRAAVRRHTPLDEVEAVLAVAADVSGEARSDLGRALDGLKPRDRRLIEEVKLKGQSLAEAARDLGITPGAAKVALHRAMKALEARVRSLEY